MGGFGRDLYGVQHVKRGRQLLDPALGGDFADTDGWTMEKNAGEVAQGGFCLEASTGGAGTRDFCVDGVENVPA